MMPFKIHCIDVKNSLQNYIWLLEHTPTHQVAVIDPTEAVLVQDYCTEHGLELSQIWLTHWHKDHIGGVPDLIQKQSLPYMAQKLSWKKFRLLTIHLNMTTSSVFMVLRYRLSPYRGIP